MKTFTQFLNEVTRVDVERYKNTHGNPHGSGTWFFHTTRDPINFKTEKADKDYFQFRGNYADAKKAAQEHFKDKVAIYLMT